MLRVFIFMTFIFSASLGQAAPKPQLYQVDLIAFTHLKSLPPSTETRFIPLLAPDMRQAISLQQQNITSKPYHLLSASASLLRNEYWSLNRKPEYQVLFHHSWLQPSRDEKTIALSEPYTGGWHIEGIISIKQNNYYTLDTVLLFSAQDSPQSTFIFSQKQRLKPNVVYYLDHPQAGMLIKIHPLS